MLSMLSGGDTVVSSKRAAKVGWCSIAQPLGNIGNGEIGVGEQLLGNFAAQAVAVRHGRYSVSPYKLSSKLTLAQMKLLRKLLGCDVIRVMQGKIGCGHLRHRLRLVCACSL